MFCSLGAISVTRNFELHISISLELYLKTLTGGNRLCLYRILVDATFNTFRREKNNKQMFFKINIFELFMSVFEKK
jgi:hypothetical protein